MHIALLYEHPNWSADLLARAVDRDLAITPIDVSQFILGVPNRHDDVDLWVNRVNAMPSTGRPQSVVAATGHILLTLELAGERVVNGSQTHRIGGSKAAQAALFAQLGLGTPASIGIYQADQAVDAANALGYPVLTKPNVGGSGSGIVRYDSPDELHAAIEAGSVDLGIDGTGLVQRVIESADGLLHRVEILGTDFFYGTEQQLQLDAFNYCAVDGAMTQETGPAIELFTPDATIIEQAVRVMTAASTHVGGVEYIIDRSTGKPSFYDFNPYSNFVTGYDDQLGFNPIDRYLDFLLTLG